MAPPDDIATAVCNAVNLLAGKDTSVVSCSVLANGPRSFAMAMLRENPSGPFLSGTASVEDRSAAVVKAVLTSLDMEDGILAAVARRWGAREDVKAVSVIENAVVRIAVGDTDATAAHLGLSKTMPAAGRLAVATADSEHRVLLLPSSAIAVSTTPGAEALEEIDAWMANAEAMAP
jgi:hypothetical protein